MDQKIIHIAVVGPQFSDPVDLVCHIAFRYKAPINRTWIFQDVHHHDPHTTDSDSILESPVVVESSLMLVFQAPVHAIWDLSRTYHYVLANADVIIHMLCAVGQFHRLNIRDFEVLSSEYKRLSRTIPCMTLLNDGGYGDRPPYKVAPEEIQKLCLNGCQPIVTALQRGNYDQEGEEGLNIVLEKLLPLSRSLSLDKPQGLLIDTTDRIQHYSVQLTPSYT